MKDDRADKFSDPAELSRDAQLVGQDWKGSKYYQDAEAWLSPFWGQETPFRRLFSELDLVCVLELACGHGRHSFELKEMATEIILMDINEENIAVCRDRFAGMAKFTCIRNDGFSFRPVPDGACSAIFCYDAMVHFDSEVIFSYLRDSFRILRQGGMGLFHHSNYTSNPGGDYRKSLHWRNFMSRELFSHYACKAGLEVVETVLLDWGGERDLDCLSLVRKPRK
jgi:SAM-dependent methyltransferase